MSSKSYAVFYNDGNKEWSKDVFFGFWNGETAAHAVKKSGVEKQLTNHVFVLPRTSRIEFTRTAFAPVVDAAVGEETP